MQVKKNLFKRPEGETKEQWAKRMRNNEEKENKKFNKNTKGSKKKEEIPNVQATKFKE